jgi:hypothetical protein
MMQAVSIQYASLISSDQLEEFKLQEIRWREHEIERDRRSLYYHFVLLLTIHSIYKLGCIDLNES